jgi:hypothetical protein
VAIDYSYRRWAAADTIIRIVRRDRPDAVRELCAQLHGVFGFQETCFNDETCEVIAAWCSGLNLGCEAIRFEVEALSLYPRLLADNPSVQDHHSLDDDDDDRPFYRLPWIPGESKRQFTARAHAEFYRHKKAEVESGGIVASNRINPKHIDWFVRFQTNGDPYDRIAKSEHTDRNDVKRAIRGIATLLDLKLRPTTPGRPRGSGAAKSPASHVVRRERRR